MENQFQNMVPAKEDSIGTYYVNTFAFIYNNDLENPLNKLQKNAQKKYFLHYNLEPIPKL